MDKICDQKSADIFLEATARLVLWKKFKNLAKFGGKDLCHSLFIKVVGLRSGTLRKKRLQHSCFSVNIAKYLSTVFLQNTAGWMILILLFLTTCIVFLKFVACLSVQSKTDYDKSISDVRNCI